MPIKQYHAKSEYQVDLGTTTNVDVPLPKMKAKTIAVDAIKTAKKDQESEDYSADVSRLIPEVAKLKRQLFTMQCIIAALVVLLILSWTYIALSCFKTENSEDRRKTEVDLELGEGPRSTTRIRKSRRTRGTHQARGTRESHHSVRESSISEAGIPNLRVIVNSGRGLDNLKRSARGHRSGHRSSRKSMRNSHDQLDTASRFLRHSEGPADPEEASSHRSRKSRKGMRSSRHHRHSRQNPVSSRGIH